MDNVMNATLIWFIIGFVLFVLEFMVPGLILFFFAIGAWLVAIILMLFDIPLNAQLSIFLVASLLSVLLFRKNLKKRLWKKTARDEVMNSEFIGAKAVAETSIGPGQDGKVSYRGTSWQARSEDRIEPGQEVIITDNKSILLIVKLIQQL